MAAVALADQRVRPGRHLRDADDLEELVVGQLGGGFAGPPTFLQGTESGGCQAREQNGPG